MMRFKVDENLHSDIAEALRRRGHDAVTVYDQQMRGNPDSRLGQVCQAEGRAIVSLDLDFANVRDYPPEDYPGLIVLRLVEQSRPYVLRVFKSVLDLLEREELAGSLWIVESIGCEFAALTRERSHKHTSPTIDMVHPPATGSSNPAPSMA